MALIVALAVPMGAWAAKPAKKVPYRTEKCVKKASKATANGVKAAGKGTARASDYTVYGVERGAKAVGRGFKKLVT